MDETKMISTRMELYGLVWSIPMWTLAKHMGVSDKGIALICKRNNIPRPPRGYWRKIETCHKVKKTPLPIPKPVEKLDYEYQFRLTVKEDDTKHLVESHMPDSFSVSEALRYPHPLIQKSSELLNRAEFDYYERLVSTDENCLDIQVSQDQLDRALRNMEALIKALETKGYKVSISNGSTSVDILGVSIAFEMREEIASIRKGPEYHNIEIEGYYSFGYDKKKYKHELSGRLSLSITKPKIQIAWGNREKWRDTKRTRLEDLLGSFVERLVRTAVVMKSKGGEG